MSTEQHLQQQIQTALEESTPLHIQGGNSKSFYGNPVNSDTILSTAQHCGIVDYQVPELFVTARAGTLLTDLEAALAEKQQILPFEAPIFSPNTTVGGAIAAGLSGPRSPYFGSIRDSVLGVKIINGHGDIVSFGGQVMKNVAGYDMSRLMAGSLGTLGLILEVSLKVAPMSEVEATLMLPCPHEEAIENFNLLRQSGLPISASCYIDGEVFVRISGKQAHIDSLIQRHAWETCPDGDVFWQSIRNHTHSFFDYSETPLWRLSVAPASPISARLNSETMIEWGGGVRWINSNTPAKIIITSAQKKGGHATLFKGAIPQVKTFPKPPPALLKIHNSLKQKLDPKGIFNPGRIY